MRIKRYDEKLLGLLLDKYERSQLYTDANKRRQSISIPINSTFFPEYMDEASMEFETIHQQFLVLRDKGYIDLVWKDGREGHILQKCTLRPEYAEELYRYLSRVPKYKKEESFLQFSEKLRVELESEVKAGSAVNKKEDIMDKQKFSGTEVCITFIHTMAERVRNSQSVKSWCDITDLAAFERMCRLIRAIETNDREQFIREFSVRFFHDSKMAEREIHHAVHIIREFSDDPSLKDLDTDQILEEYHIYRNPAWVMIKGKGCFRMHGNQSPMVRVADFSGGLGIAGGDIKKILWDRNCVPERVVTCENLTSFHRWSDEKTLLIYLGGYHNSVKRAFLKGLGDIWGEQVSFYHFGDIDAGGFKIWKDLCLKTGISFAPYRMDLAVYEKYKRYGRPLTAGDRRELTKMKQDPFFVRQTELFDVMLRENVKLEQECVIEE